MKRIKELKKEIANLEYDITLKDNPSVEQLLHDLKNSDNYLMSNPLQEEYESVFDY